MTSYPFVETRCILFLATVFMIGAYAVLIGHILFTNVYGLTVGNSTVGQKLSPPPPILEGEI